MNGSNRWFALRQAQGEQNSAYFHSNDNRKPIAVSGLKRVQHDRLLDATTVAVFPITECFVKV